VDNYNRKVYSLTQYRRWCIFNGFDCLSITRLKLVKELGKSFKAVFFLSQVHQVPVLLSFAVENVPRSAIAYFPPMLQYRSKLSRLMRKQGLCAVQ
jgi:hypothetical protein